MFELEPITTYRPFLHHRSSLGEFFLTSDSVMPTWGHWKRTADLISHIPASELEQFRTIAHQIGGKLVFPGMQIGRMPTINQARVGSKIADRLDLTLECIRLHYLREDSPLAGVLDRYRNFFALFKNFKGYTDFFLLQDLVSEDDSRVEFLVEFKDFSSRGFDLSVEEYGTYRENGISFVQSRNRRMDEWVRDTSSR